MKLGNSLDKLLYKRSGLGRSGICAKQGFTNSEIKVIIQKRAFN
jgi:hypothetical protein